MYCKECRVSVDTDFNICPLCHATLVVSKDDDALVIPFSNTDDSTTSRSSLFPKASPRRKLIHSIPVTSVFLGVFVPIFITLLALDIIYFELPTWSLVVGSVFLLGYIIIRNAILSDCGFGMRIAYLLFGFILYFYAIQTLTPTIEFATTITLPALISLALIANSVLLAYKGSSHGSLYVSSMIFSMLSFLPLILAVSGVVSISITAIVTAVFGAVGVIATLIVGRGKLWTCFKMVFHN